MNKEVKELIDTIKQLLSEYSPKSDAFTLEDYDVEYNQLKGLVDYINQLEEKIRISQEHPFLSKEAFKKIKIKEDKEIEKLDENNTNVMTNIIENRKKINELIDAVNELKKGK